MPFVQGDKRINRVGRPRNDERFADGQPTRRQLKEREMLMLLRKLKPHVAESIIKASKIMGDNTASHQNQLKAAAMILDLYRKLTLDMYDGKNPDEDDEPADEIQRQAPMTKFSLTVVKDEE